MLDIDIRLARLSEAVNEDGGLQLDPLMESAIQQVLGDLKMSIIPALTSVEHPERLVECKTWLAEALREGEPHRLLKVALKTMRVDPGSSDVAYYASQACIELSAFEVARDLMAYTLWINPAHAAAALDLQGLNEFLKQQ